MTELATISAASEDRMAIDVAAAELEAAFGLAEQQGLSLAEWYLRTWGELDQRIATIKERADMLMRQARAAKAALQFVHGRDFEAQVNRDLDAQKGRKKSVDYLTGRAGFRSVGGKPTLLITDEEAVIAGAEIACPEAVRRSIRKTELVEHIRGGGEIPGATVVETEKRDRFYPAIEQPLLEGDTTCQ